VTTFWDKMRSGWGVVWCVKIEGVPGLWTERDYAGLGAHSETVYPDLVIDKSAEIGSLADRNTGLGAGLPLTVRLRDTTAVRAAIQAPTLETALTASITWNAATINVDDTSSFPAAPSTIHIGTEQIRYSGKNATQFTGCTRGVWSRPLPHTVGASSAIVGNRPRHWRGRMVELWAVLVTPDGLLDAAQDYDDGKCCWRGWVSTEPRRKDGGFEFECLALDRILERPLKTASQGEVIGVGTAFVVDSSFTFRVQAEMYDALGVLAYQYDIVVAPFDGLAPGTVYTTAQAHAAIQTAWAAALAVTSDTVASTVATTHFKTTLEIMPVSAQPGSKGQGGFSLAGAAWSIFGRPNPDAAIMSIRWSVDVGDKHTCDWFSAGPVVAYMQTGGLTGGDIVPLNWLHGGDPQVCSAQGEPAAAPTASGIVVRFDDITATPPTSGVIKIGDASYPYTGAQQAGGAWFLTGCQVPADSVGKSAQIDSSTSATYPDLMREVLVSADAGGSGFDLLGHGNGYAVPESDAYDDGGYLLAPMDSGSFDEYAQAALSIAGAQLAGQSGKSFAELFGGALVLSQRAVVMREAGPLATDRCGLALVATDPGGSAYTDTIDNAALLSVGVDAITPVDTREQITSVKATFASKDAQDPLTVTVIDGPEMSVLGGGGVDAQLLAVAYDKAEATAQVLSWASGLLRVARTIQAVDVTLPPWRDVRIGQVVAVDLRHPDLWDAVTGSTSLVGFARVIGLKRKLQDCATTVTLLLASGDNAELCPSMPVLRWTGPDNDPTDVTVSVEAATFIELARTKANLAAVYLRHTRPGCGTEDSGGNLSVTPVLSAGIPTGVLTVNLALTLGEPLDGTSELTWDDTVTNAYYDAFCHVGDASKWA